MFRPLNPFTLHEKLPRWGNWLSRALSRFFLRLGGWQYQGEIPNLSKAVIIAAPHTSSWDWPIGMFAILGVGVKVYWLGKTEFVNGRFRRTLHYLGGIPVDRSASNGVVDQIAQQFHSRAQFLLALAPEGTRQAVDGWKLGFYYIAKAADVPIIPVSLDYGRKWVEIGTPISAHDEIEVVLQKVTHFYKDVVGQNHDQASLSLREIRGD